MSSVLTPLVALLPVVAFLGLLRAIDSFKLVTLTTTLRSVLVGGAVAMACFYLNRWLIGALPLSELGYTRTIAPALEELLKALFLVVLIRGARVGFVVDAAIHGFAIGAGFAVVENVYYLFAIDAPSILVWVVRGFGTAIMHGSTTAIMGMLAKGLCDRHGSTGLQWFLPGFAIAFAIHAAFNQFLLPPLASTLILLLVLPLLVVFVFERSEKATRKWLGVGFDTDVQFLEQIMSGELSETRVGRYLHSLRTSLAGPIVGDMLSLLQLQLELSVRAKGILMAREIGLDVPVGDDVRPKLEELRYLESSIGTAGRLAMHPILQTSSRELWQLYVLGK